MPSRLENSIVAPLWFAGEQDGILASLFSKVNAGHANFRATVSFNSSGRFPTVFFFSFFIFLSFSDIIFFEKKFKGRNREAPKN